MRRALVTGGASPLGAAICRRLAADGVHVFIHAHAGLARAEELAAELRQALADSPYTPSAPVRVVSDAELMHEMNLSDAARVILSRV